MGNPAIKSRRRDVPLVKCPHCDSDEIDSVEDLQGGRRQLRCERGHEWIVGTSRPDPAVGVRLVVPGDDAEYLAWISTWPNGYVLNCLASRNPLDSRLHRAWCTTIGELQPDKATFVGEWIKVCSTDRHRVKEWAVRECGEIPRSCQLCM